MGKSTISMAMFNSFLYVYQAGYIPYIPLISHISPIIPRQGIAMAPSCCRTASASLRCDGTAPRGKSGERSNKNGGCVTPF